ncbi:hypothetical protein IQ265_16515 [Nodosilinea sp. LEGE 06152]|uniref:hypothetical protein n=1 Tax=Nodosilinea sp. LEGE 06152 TaxID=2777966 RepID=UPI0018801E91|nr:hypothetical protein [Nodosilinea sp. LEGE 06152]MBE9158422.1 hypothetical protein [Nodosilinea sp. LEGE 06152]
MEQLASRLRRQLWLLLALVGASLAIAVPGHTGSVPTGQGSGVTVGGSSILTIGAPCLGNEEQLDSNAPSCLGSGEYLESTSPNATVDPFTGEVTLTAGAQQTLNASANQVLQGLQSTNPALAAALTNPGGINLNSLSPVGAISEGEDVEQTANEIAAAAVAAIASSESVSLISSQGTLSIAAPTGVPGAQPTTLATSAVFTPVGGTPMVMPLRGTLDQIANAAGFLAASFAAGLAPSQVATFTEMALVGIDYAELVFLFNAVSGLLPAQPQGTVATVVNATQLESAIQAYNRILDNTDPAALVTLTQFEDFVVLGRSLQQLRAAVDVQAAAD